MAVVAVVLAVSSVTVFAAELLVPDQGECVYLGRERERFQPAVLRGESFRGRITRQVTATRARDVGSMRTQAFQGVLGSSSSNFIDQLVWDDLRARNIPPAGKTTDYEFIRRVSLDLTGRIPAAARVTQFVTSTDPNRRAALIGELVDSPAWADKWTMFLGDLFKNTAANTQVNIRPEGRNAFYKYIHDSVASNKPYNRIAQEIIAAQGTNSFDQTNGQMNFLPLNVVGGGPTQDIFDAQAAGIATTFLGMAHVNCILCHNGRGHLDSLSLWGSQATRVQGWGLAAFLSHTYTRRIATPKDPNNPNVNYDYWSLEKYTTDYNLNTTTGNRPSRQPIGAVRTITPSYLFGGAKPASGEDYRAALARIVTADPQFARAAVNYIWAALFGRGIVDPPDQFDPARLDPDNPPPAPWTLQPSNPKLLNALAKFFVDSNYDLKTLMRQIANSDTYQLASEYDGNWDPSWEPYFGRKLVRRLWSEELHDSVITAIGTLPSYTVRNFTDASTVYGVDSPGLGKISYAMQAPDVVNMPDGGGAVSQFLDAFLRGNRDDQPRKAEGSILQTLGLMNDNFIQSRIHATGTGATATYLMNALPLPDDQLITKLYMDVLSRPPNTTERTLTAAQLTKGGTAARKTNAEDVLWTLFNKVDFAFNY